MCCVQGWVLIASESLIERFICNLCLLLFILSSLLLLSDSTGVCKENKQVTDGHVLTLRNAVFAGGYDKGQNDKALV